MTLGERVWELVSLSEREMTRLHKKWRDAERTFMLYTPQREIDRKREAERESGKPEYTTIILPYSYAMLMAAHTYLATVFLSRDPIFQFTSRHGEGQRQVIALEAVVDYQVRVGRMVPALYAWLLDVGKFGLGVLRVWWESRIRSVASVAPDQRSIFATTIPGYVGTRIANVRPHDFLPDPRVPLMQFQEGEFCAVRFYLSSPELLARARRGEFDPDAVMRLRARASENSREGYESPPVEPPAPGAIELFEVFVRLFPSEWNLARDDSDLEAPMLWRFVISRGGEEVLSAEPWPSLWDGFPFVVQPFEPDPYTLNARSILDVLDPIQDTMDWLVNSHMFNVRQMTNGTLIVDQSRVHVEDLLREPAAGRIIRAKPSAIGSDLRTAIFYLTPPDVTQRHFQDLQMMHEFGQRALGINDQIMGMLQGGGRKTATEVRTATTFGTNRLRVAAEFISSLGMRQLADMIVAQTQQWMPERIKLRAVGNLAALAGQQFLEVGPEDISGEFDFIPVDGTLPIDRYAQVVLWKDLLAQISQIPQIAQKYDFAKIFGWLAQLAGIRNLDVFLISDEEAIRGAESGELVAFTGGAGAPPPTTNAPGLEAIARVLGGGGGGPS